MVWSSLGMENEECRVLQNIRIETRTSNTPDCKAVPISTCLPNVLDKKNSQHI